MRFGKPWEQRKDSRPQDSRRYLSVMFSPVVSLRTLKVAVPDGREVVFLSDVHLGYGTAEQNKRREDQLLSVLESIQATCCHLFIVGDLFDYWFDYRRVVPRQFVRTLASLHRLRAQGMPITYLMGNHDFGHYTYFRDELGIEVEAGDLDVDLGGIRCYVSHGDGKAANDTGYLILRSVLRNRLAQALYRWIHPDLGIALASGTSHGSRDYTSDKDYGPTDGLRLFAEQRLQEGYHIVVMGHRHHATHEQMHGGHYVNLGHWLGTDPTYAVYRPSHGIHLVRPDAV